MIRPLTKHSGFFYFLFFFVATHEKQKLTNLITKICIPDFGLDTQIFPVSLAYKHSSTCIFPLGRAIIARNLSIFAGNSFVWPKKNVPCSLFCLKALYCHNFTVLSSFQEKVLNYDNLRTGWDGFCKVHKKSYNFLPNQKLILTDY